MNIFFVIGNTIYTPATMGAILKGITRDSIIKILKNNGYDVVERPVTIEEVYEAAKSKELKEVFGTGTAAVVSFVEQIHFEGEDIFLNPDEFKIAPFVKDQLNGMRSGRLEDAYKWTEEII